MSLSSVIQTAPRSTFGTTPLQYTGQADVAYSGEIDPNAQVIPLSDTVDLIPTAATLSRSRYSPNAPNSASPAMMSATAAPPAMMSATSASPFTGRSATSATAARGNTPVLDARVASFASSLSISQPKTLPSSIPAPVVAAPVAADYAEDVIRAAGLTPTEVIIANPPTTSLAGMEAGSERRAVYIQAESPAGRVLVELDDDTQVGSGIQTRATYVDHPETNRYKVAETVVGEMHPITSLHTGLMASMPRSIAGISTPVAGSMRSIARTETDGHFDVISMTIVSSPKSETATITDASASHAHAVVTLPIVRLTTLRTDKKSVERSIREANEKIDAAAGKIMDKSITEKRKETLATLASMREAITETERFLNASTNEFLRDAQMTCKKISETEKKLATFSDTFAKASLRGTLSPADAEKSVATLANIENVEKLSMDSARIANEYDETLETVQRAVQTLNQTLRTVLQEGADRLSGTSGLMKDVSLVVGRDVTSPVVTLTREVVAPTRISLQSASAVSDGVL